MNDPLHHVLYLASGTILLVLALVVQFRHKTENRLTRKYLLGYLWTFFLAVVTGYLVLTPVLAQRFPHVFRTAHFFYSLVMPFSWLYFREVLRPGRSSWKDLWLFIPVALYVVDFMPVFLKSADEKRAMLSQLNNFGLRISYAEGWIMPSGFYHTLRSSMFVICWGLQAVLFFRSKPLEATGPMEHMQRRWMAFLLWSGVLIFMPNIIMGMLERPDLTMQWSNFAALTAALIQGYFLLLHPGLLYGPIGDSTADARLPGKRSGLAHPEKPQDNKPAYYDQLDEQSVREIETAIATWIQQKQVYLNPELTLAGLSSLSGIGLHKWSAYLNKFQQLGFNDYINRNRVEYCVQKMHDGEHRSKTLEALSQESGFNSRSTFIRAFKKFKGLTPSEYLEARELS
jgi:AraC-like DNA-binding protein